MSDRRIPPAGDPIHAAPPKPRRRTEAELAESIHEDEIKLGRPHTPSERDGFTRGFHGQEYSEEIRRLMALGVEEPGGDGEEGS
jgi:hypothetical protein